MSDPGSDKKQLRNIFEESLKEISSEGTDEFRRSVTDVLDDKRKAQDQKKDEPEKKEKKSGGLNTPEL